MLTCAKFLTTSDYAPRLRARLQSNSNSSTTPTPAAGRVKVERHQATRQRLLQLLEQLGESETH